MKTKILLIFIPATLASVNMEHVTYTRESTSLFDNMSTHDPNMQESIATLSGKWSLNVLFLSAI